MEALKIQVKCFINKNKYYMLMFLIYSAVMISIMAGMQADVPFANEKNFFENNHIIINILILQATILVLGFYRDNINYMLKQGISKGRAYIGNIINSIIFSLASSGVIVIAFCITFLISSKNNNFGLDDIYYFGLEVYGVNSASICKMIILTFAACIVVMAICNLLALGSKLWTWIFAAVLFSLFLLSIWGKSYIVNEVSGFFQWYRAPYIICIALTSASIVLFLIGWFLTKKISFNNDK